MKQITLLFLLLPGFLCAKTVIKGTTLENRSETINLVMYEDYFNYSEVNLAKSAIAADGSFEITLDTISSPFYGILRIGDVKAGIYLSPASAYTLEFPAYIDNEFDGTGHEKFVELKYIDQHEDDLNALIAEFSIQYEEFIVANIGFFIRKRAKHQVDTFVTKINHFYEPVKNEYFQNYLKYVLATIEESSRHNRKDLYTHCFENQPILYEHDAYMNYFHEFYAQYFKILPIADYDKLIQILKVKMSRTELDELMAKDQYLKNDTIRELVMIKSLQENFHHPEFSKKGVLYILRDIGMNGLVEEHKILATSIVTKLSSVSIGSYAPEFSLETLEGDSVSLSELRGKYVYIDFWATWCTPCVKEMKLMPALIKKYGKQITFVSISIDKKKKLMTRFFKKNETYQWTHLYAGADHEINDDYKVRGVPLYYLIDPDGKVVQSPAYRPSGKISTTFDRIMAQNSGRKKRRWEEVSDH